MRRALGCGRTAVTGTSIQDGNVVNQTIYQEIRNALNTGGMKAGTTGLVTQGKDLSAAKRFAQVEVKNSI